MLTGIIDLDYNRFIHLHAGKTHCLIGKTYEHVNFPDGSEISTSNINSIECKGEDVYAKTRSGSRYLLRNINQEMARHMVNEASDRGLEIKFDVL